MYNQPILKKIAGKYAYGLLTNSSRVSTLSKKGDPFGMTNGYCRLLKKTFGYEPPYQAAEVTVAALVLEKTIEDAGDLNHESIRNALRKINSKSFYERMHFNSNESYPASVATIQMQRNGICVVCPESATTCKPIYLFPNRYNEQ